MQQILRINIFLFLLLVLNFSNKAQAPAIIPIGILKLKNAYPNHITDFSANAIVWKDGEIMEYNAYNDYMPIDTMLVYPDLEDMLKFEYPIGELSGKPDSIHEAGRIRYEPFFKKMYGATYEEVKQNLTTIVWLPGIANQRLKVTTVNDVDKKLQAISNELLKLPKSYHKYLKPSAGTFNWRTVSGSPRLSAHSFGIAIDLNVKYANYWDWDKTMGFFRYRNQIPYEIVQIFERHGFIWGGKWQHYDTMHFEYRPEILEMIGDK